MGERRTASPDRLPRARRRFGQHFLEAAWADRLVAALDAGPADAFLEIGPGRGVLTTRLAPRVAQFVGVEVDRDLAARLPALLPPHARIVEGDVLSVDLETVLAGMPRPVRVVGNLPYNISSPILFRLLAAADHGRTFADATLMLQKEVVDRLTAAPGGGDYGTLSVQAQLLADVERVMTLPPGAFRPPPAVTSAVVRLRFRPPVVDAGDLRTFERLVRGVFLQRRKMLANALQPVAHASGHDARMLLEAAGLDPRRRPETLTVAEMAGLSRALGSSAASARPVL